MLRECYIVIHLSERNFFVFWRSYDLNIKKVSVLWSRGIQSHYRDPSLKIIEILVQRGTDVRKKIGKPIAVLQ